MNESSKLPSQERALGSAFINKRDSLSVGDYRLIYIFSHPGISYHEGRLKIGMATVNLETLASDFLENQEDPRLKRLLEAAANARIRSYHNTADIQYSLEHVELAVRKDDQGNWEGFRDYEIHNTLLRSGYKKAFAREDKESGEWFVVDLPTAKTAIEAYKTHNDYIGEHEVALSFTLRPSQEEAVKQTLKAFSKATLQSPVSMLWNAKMRFGKTLTTYAFVKRWEEVVMKARAKGARVASPTRVLILTHKPLDTSKSWSKDFTKFGMPAAGWRFGSDRGGSDVGWKELNRKKNSKFFYFASIQGLRNAFGQSESDDKYLAERKEVFSTQWDLVISDEVHNGTMTDRAKRVYRELQSPRLLDLSGTPFNVIQAEQWEDEELASRFAYGENVFSWSYVDERKAKAAWEKTNPGEPSPYDELPEIKFVTYDISATIPALKDVNSGGIDMRELFRVNTTENEMIVREPDGTTRSVEAGKFIHEKQVLTLLKKMRGWDEVSDDASRFPFHRSWEANFNHTLWMLPSVDACVTLEALMGENDSPFFGFKVINATGRGSKDWSEKSALEQVQKTIKESKISVTLSWGMLTAGVTVPEWTAVFMLNNVSSPMAYMQTAFRAASAGSLPDGRTKDTAYVFDFNPDRCLRQIVELAKFNSKTAADSTDQEEQDRLNEDSVKEYLSYISILSLKGAKFIEPDSDYIMKQLEQVYINEIISRGFDSSLLWNGSALRSFDMSKARILEQLRILGGGKVGDEKSQVRISQLTEEAARELLEKRKRQREADKAAQEAAATGNPPTVEPMSAEELTRLQELEEKKKADQKNRKNGEAALVGFTARLPMLVMAATLKDENVSGDAWMSEFIDSIDDQSWSEFMPKQLKRVRPAHVLSLDEDPDRLGREGGELYWDDIKRFFDSKIFALAGKQVRQEVREAFKKPPVERSLRIAAIISRFKNPDKETVLTPARVVELQYSSTIGGLGLFDLERSTAKNPLALVRNLEKDKAESLPLQQAVRALSEGTHVVEPLWRSSESVGDSFWQSNDLSLYDINSKTALYPLWGALSSWYKADRYAYRVWKEKEINASLSDEEIDNEIWEDIVEQAIFANVRVPYSKSIALRVLAGFDEELRGKLERNITVIDVIALKDLVKNWNSTKKADRKDYWKPIEDEYDFIGKILRLANVGFMESHAREVWNSLKRNESYAFLLNNLGKINEGDIIMDDFRKLKVLVDSINGELPKFEATVGNPPYSVTTGSADNGKKHGSSDVFHYFQFISLDISKFSSLVYPSTWTKDVTVGLGAVILKQADFVRTFRIGELFPEAFVGTSIVMFKEHLNTLLKSNGVEVGRESVVWSGDEITQIIQSKINGFPKILPPVDVAKVGNLEDLDLKVSEERLNESDISLYMKRKRGTQADSGVFFIEKGIFEDRWPTYKNIEKFKVCVRYRLLGRTALFDEQVFKRNKKGLRTDVFKSNEFSGSTQWEWASFETQEEAENFSAYLNTMLIAQIAAIDINKNTFGSQIPDLIDYTSQNSIFANDSTLNENHIFKGRDLESRLYIHFGFTHHEIRKVKSAIEENTRAKRAFGIRLHDSLNETQNILDAISYLYPLAIRTATAEPIVLDAIQYPVPDFSKIVENELDIEILNTKERLSISVDGFVDWSEEEEALSVKERFMSAFKLTENEKQLVKTLLS